MKLLANKPEQRYQTPRELMAELQRIGRSLGMSVAATPAGGDAPNRKEGGGSSG
jgi:hypothetical protein